MSCRCDQGRPGSGKSLCDGWFTEALQSTGTARSCTQVQQQQSVTVGVEALHLPVVRRRRPFQAATTLQQLSAGLWQVTHLEGQVNILGGALGRWVTCKVSVGIDVDPDVRHTVADIPHQPVLLGRVDIRHQTMQCDITLKGPLADFLGKSSDRTHIETCLSRTVHHLYGHASGLVCQGPSG